MPRKRQRFNRLDGLYRAVRGQIPPGNTELTNYIEWRKGNRSITVDQKLSPEQRRRFGFAILPFNIEISSTPTPDDRYVAPITSYSNEGRKSAALGTLSDAELGYETINGDTRQDDNFYPALLRVFVKDNPTAESVNKTSGITGESYKRHAGKSYSIPFGRTLTGDDDADLSSSGEDSVKTTLIAKIRPLAAVGGVSYEPELFRVNRILASPTT